MNKKSNKKGLRNKITAILLSICISAVSAPAVFAESLSDDGVSTQSEQTRQASQPSDYNKTASVGFENVESDGGTMLVGTARIPKADGSFATVKFIYSSGINLNDKSLDLINKELNACGVTVSGSMVYVSRSDLVSDSTLVAETSERKAVFACGSEAAPTVLTAYPAYQSVEESFEYLYKGYVYSISEYTSLSGVFAGRSEITLSDDGKSAYTSIVMEEDYVDKVINGKTVKILMINSELKYCFRAPKMVYVKDDNYNVASASDTVYHYGSTTASTSQTTASSTTSAAVSSDELIVTSDNQSTTTAASATASQTVSATASTDTQSTTDTTTVNIWDYITTASEPKITAGASPIVTSTTQSTTIMTTSTSAAAAITESTTTVSTTTATTTAATTSTVVNNQDNQNNQSSTTATLPALTTQSSQNSAVIPNVTTNESQSSQRGIINTRRLPLNVRSGPGKSYMVVTVLPRGTYVTVLDTSNPDWYMIKTMGKVVGYAYSGYIKIM